SVELGVEHLFPRAEIEFSTCDRQHDLVTHDRALQMRVGIVLSGLMVPVVDTGWRQLLEPRLEVADQPFLPVVHIHASSDVHRGERTSEPRQAPGVGPRRKVNNVSGYKTSAASAFRSSEAMTPARNLRSPAAAIIAALSVESVRLGRNVGISRR